MVETSTTAVSTTLDNVLSGMEVINYNIVCLTVLVGVLLTAVIGVVLASFFKDWFK